PLIDASIPFFRLPAFKDPQNSDVVVFKYPKDEKLDYIKRCVAVGGQTVEVRNGELFIDGKPEGTRKDLGREYDIEDGRYMRYTRITTPEDKSYVIRHYADGYSHGDNFGPVTVPEGHFFMMGDNRDNSRDSRWFGAVARDLIVGRTSSVVFSLDASNHFLPRLDRFFHSLP
ncbi:MAG: signal peptidase I, partial [Planctomycetes bacterium]|nr:signal peptidase I [Planctomycetota bacterium]